MAYEKQIQFVSKDGFSFDFYDEEYNEKTVSADEVLAEYEKEHHNG